VVIQFPQCSPHIFSENNITRNTCTDTMPEDEFKLSDLREALLNERDSKQLMDIKGVFYKKLRKYLNELEDEIDEIGLPSDSRSKALHREYNRAKNYADDLFSRRAQKISLAAVHYVAGSKKVEIESMTKREEKLFNDMVDLLEEMEEEIFFGGYKRGVEKEEKDVADKKVPKTEKKDEVKEKESPKDIKVEEKKIKDKEQIVTDKVSSTEEDKIPSKDPEKDFSEILIHVMENVPPFVDMDATYDLKKEDVVTLREDIAKVLIKRGKARKVEID